MEIYCAVEAYYLEISHCSHLHFWLSNRNYIFFLLMLPDRGSIHHWQPVGLRRRDRRLLDETLNTGTSSSLPTPSRLVSLPPSPYNCDDIWTMFFPSANLKCEDTIFRKLCVGKMARRYDTRTTIFSPEGRLYQVPVHIIICFVASASGLRNLWDPRCRRLRTRQSPTNRAADPIYGGSDPEPTTGRYGTS